MTPSLDHPVHSFIRNCSKWFSRWQFYIRWCLLEKEKNKMHFVTQKSSQTLWKNVRIFFFLVAVVCQQLGTHLISNPELWTGEQPLWPGGSPPGERSPVLNPGSALGSPRPPPAPRTGRMPLSLQRGHGVS